MSRNEARDAVADRRFATASIPGGLSKPLSFHNETAYLSLGILTADECAAAERVICRLGAKAGVSDDEVQEILDMLLKDYRR